MKMSWFKKYLKVFSIFVISFLSLVTLIMIFAFCIGDVNDCKKIFTNVMITKFTFYNKKIRCAKNDYFDDNTGQLKDKLNKEIFPNAIITKIWDWYYLLLYQYWLYVMIILYNVLYLLNRCIYDKIIFDVNLKWGRNFGKNFKYVSWNGWY